MKSPLSLIFAALVVLLGSMLWIVRDHRSSTGAPAAVEPTVVTRVVTRVVPATQPAAVAGIVAAAAVVTPAAHESPLPMVHVNEAGEIKYIARPGDTLSQLAIAMLGSDSQEHRNAIIAANISLQAEPDRVLAGKTYSIAASSSLSNPANTNQRERIAVAADVTENVRAVQQVSTEKVAGPELKYTAKPGDTVSSLASNLLGGDTKANRDGIVAGNTSLQSNPDHLVAGKSYTIVARNGLAGDPDAKQAKPSTTQPEADEIAMLSVGRTLRYVALPGDTVSRLAVVLLGSDTAANRKSIIESNWSLKQDPDHLVAGKTYWIAVPVADAAR